MDEAHHEATKNETEIDRLYLWLHNQRITSIQLLIGCNFLYSLGFMIYNYGYYKDE